MGRKSEKSKQRATFRKEEKARVAAALVSVKTANEQDDPLVHFPVFTKFEKNNLSAKLVTKRVKELDQKTVDDIFNLEKENMEKIYDACSWGWNEKKKYEEMTEDSAWYLMAFSSEDELIAFSHFRFDTDFGVEVLYCYELQLRSSVRRKGLGKFMLQLLELIAFKNNMRKVVLTVLKHNTPAVNFFYALRYTTDDRNPIENLYDEIPYEILSKLNKKLPPVGYEQID